MRLEKDAASLRAPNKAILGIKNRFFDGIMTGLANKALARDVVAMPNVGNDPASIKANVDFVKKRLLQAVRNNNVPGAKNLRDAIRKTTLVYDLPSMHDFRPYARDPRSVIHVGDVPLLRRDFRPLLGTSGGDAWYNSGFWADASEGLSKRKVKTLSKLFGASENNPVVYFSSGRDRMGRPLFNLQTLLHEFGHAYDDMHGGIEHADLFFRRGVRRANNPYGKTFSRGRIPIGELLRNEDLSLRLDPTLRQEYAASLAGGGNRRSRTFRGILAKYRIARAIDNYGRHMGLSDMAEILRQAKNIYGNPTNMTYDGLQKMRVGWGRKQDRVAEELLRRFGNA